MFIKTLLKSIIVMGVIKVKNIGGNALVIREVNINLVRKVLKERGEVTKRQVAESTGLSIVTVGTVLHDLAERNEVRAGKMSSSSGGRPAQQYIYNDEHALALILFPFEQEGSITIESTIVTLSGRRLHEASTNVPHIDLDAFEQVIDDTLQLYPKIGAIGFGLPGSEVDAVLVVSDYEALRGLKVAEHFKNRYNKPVVIENDVNAAVLGYCSSHMPKDTDQAVVYFYFPDRFPPGAGIFLGGKLYKGKRGFAGEVGHMPLGVQWGDTGPQASSDVLEEAISKLTVAVSSVLNPDVVVLYGSFLNEEHLLAVTEKCRAALPASTVPDILLSEDFAADYLNGMIAQTLRSLESGLSLTQFEA